jgi:PST family polysaccharide transporter
MSGVGDESVGAGPQYGTNVRYGETVSDSMSTVKKLRSRAARRLQSPAPHPNLAGAADMGAGFAGAANAVIQAAPRNGADAPATVRTATVITAVGVLQISVLAIMLLRSKVLALLLKPEGVGLVSTLDQLAQVVAQVSALSLISTPTRFIARVVSDGLGEVTAMYSALLKLLVVSTLAGAAVAAALLYLNPNALGASLHGYGTLAAIAVLSAPLLALSGYFANVSAAVEGYSTTGLYLLFAALGSLAAAYFGIRINGIAGLYYANLIVGAVSVIAIAAYLRAAVPLQFRVRASGLRDAIRRHPDIVKYCSTTYVLSFAQPLTFLIVRSVLLQRLGAKQAGYFQAAFAVSSIASLVLMQAIRVYLEPAVNRASDDRAKIAAANEFQRTFALLILLGTLPLVLFPADVIAALSTRAFTPVSAVVYLFVLADCLFLCNQVYATVVMAVDDFRGFFQVNIAGHLTLCAGVWLLTGRFGLAGVAWSFLLARVVVFVLTQALLIRRHGIRMATRSAAVLTYSVGALATAATVFGSASVPSFAGAAMRCLAIVVVAGAGGVFLTKDERAWVVRAALPKGVRYR